MYPRLATVLATALIVVAPTLVTPPYAAARARTAPRGLDDAGAVKARKVLPRVAVTSLTLFLKKAIGLDAKQIYRIAERGLARGGLKVITSIQVQRGLATHAGLYGCETPVCLNRIGGYLRAPFCAKINVWEDAGKLQIALAITWSHSGLVAVKQTHDCRRCTAAKLRAALSGLSAVAGQRALSAYRANPPPRLRPRPRALNGVSPPGTNATGATRRRARWFRIGGIVLIAAGGAAIAAGGVLLGVHGRVSRREPHNYYIHDTKVGGSVAVALGITSVIAGAALLIYGLVVKGEPRPKVTLTFDPSRQTLGLQGHF